MRLFSKWRNRYIKEPLAEQAAAFMDRGQHNLAIRVLEKGLDIDPDYPSFLWLRAEVAVRVADFEGAIACYEDLEEVLGRDAPAALYEAKGHVFYSQKYFGQAIDAYKLAEQKGLSPLQLYVNRGIACMHIADYEGALQDFLVVEKKDPDFPDLGPLLAESYFFLKKFRTATAYFRRASHKRDLTERQFRMLADAYFEMRAYKKASIIYGTLLQRFSPQAGYYVQRASCFTYLNEPQSAIRDCDKALALQPQLAAAWNNRGYARLLLQELEKGKADIDHSLTINKENAHAYRNLAYYHIQKQAPERALRELEKAFILDKEIPQLYYLKGLALLELDEKAEALRALKISARKGETLAKEMLDRIISGEAD